MEIRENSIRACAARLPQGEGYLALSYVLDTTPGALRAKEDSLLPPEALERYEAIVARRLHGEPLQYAIGQWEFYGHLFAVDRRALIPRPETERLVEIVLDEGVGGQAVADIGTGTGAIALSIALEAQPAPSVVYATDLSREALDLAKENAIALLQPARAGMVKWIEGGTDLPCCRKLWMCCCPIRRILIPCIRKIYKQSLTMSPLLHYLPVRWVKEEWHSMRHGFLN